MFNPSKINALVNLESNGISSNIQLLKIQQRRK